MAMHALRICLAAAATVLASTALGSVPRPAPALWAGMTPGPNAVGFVAEVRPDPRRRLEGRPRPIQVACWYPALAAGAAASGPLTYRDYFVLAAGERAAASPEAQAGEIAAYKTLFEQNGIDGALVERWLQSPVFARPGVKPASHAGPLVLLAQGNGHSIHHQAILAEYLASHGYVVCTSPSQMRLGATMESDADVLPAARAQADDLAVVEREARRRFGLAATPPSIVGHSFGARSALIFAAAHRTAALVSLDGGIGAANGSHWLDGAKAIDPERFTTPTLHIYESDEPAMAPDFALLHRLRHAPRMLAHIAGIRHTDFTSLGFASAAVPGLMGEAPAELDRKCVFAALYTRMFLDAHARGISAARAFLADAPTVAWLTVERWAVGQ